MSGYGDGKNGAEVLSQMRGIPDWVRPELLRALHSAGAEQQRFHRVGNWYHPHERFPAAYADPHGFKLFATGGAFQSCPQLVLTKDVHTLRRTTIASMPGYARVC